MDPAATDITTTQPKLVLILAAASLTWFAVSSFISWYRLSHIPGPWLASISHMWMIRASTSSKLSTVFEETGERYGPLVRIGPNQVLTSDADFLRKLGAVRGAYNRGPWYIAFRWQPYMDSLFTLQDRRAHDKRKGQVSTAYNTSGREVDLIEPSIDEQVLAMVDAVRAKYVSNDERPHPPLLDFADLSSFLTMDVITRVAFGEEFGHLKTDSDITGFLANLRPQWSMISLINETPLLRSFFYSRPYLRFFGAKVTDKAGFGKLLSGVASQVHKRYSEPEAKAETQLRRDMLGSWMNHGLTQAESEAEGMLAIVAGSETTASVIRMTFLHVISNAPVYHKLKAVVKEAVRDGTVSEPISYAMAKEIPYLKAVVLEGMRMRPGATGTFPKVVPPQGDVVQGTFLPGGTVVGMNVPHMFRSTELFGPDVGLFRPERWLEAAEPRRADMERQVEMMFGSGRWMCAGKPIAFMELFKTLFELFRHFDFALAFPTRPWNSLSYNVFVEDSMWIRVTEAHAGGA